MTNAGSGIARQMALDFRITSGADRVQLLTSPDGAVAEQGDDGVFTVPLGDIEPTETDPRTFEFGVRFAEAVEGDVSWDATLRGSVQVMALPSTTTVALPPGVSPSPDRIEDEKFPMMLLTVGGSLLALLLLPLLGRWVPQTTQATVNRLVEGVLVVFLASIVLVMNLAGGLDAESAAAIIGGIGGYIFGRGVSQVVTDRTRDAPTSPDPMPPRDRSAQDAQSGDAHAARADDAD